MKFHQNEYIDNVVADIKAHGFIQVPGMSNRFFYRDLDKKHYYMRENYSLVEVPLPELFLSMCVYHSGVPLKERIDYICGGFWHDITKSWDSFTRSDAPACIRVEHSSYQRNFRIGIFLPKYHSPELEAIFPGTSTTIPWANLTIKDYAVKSLATPRVLKFLRGK